ncbi:MAG: DUF1028 domain-containing protein [Planctomycetota bacterium]|jgi:uncharacterized Ntn-hydrolase superfamily protein
MSTFSIVAFDPETGDYGVAVQSKFFGVGAVVPFAKAGVGAIATQAWGNTTYGTKGLELLASGLSAEEVVNKLTEADRGREFRQLGVVDSKGNAFAFTGEKAQEWKGHKTGKNYTCQGNILAGEEVVNAMAKAFEETKGPLADRLIKALEAGQAAGGDKRGKQSAALLVVREKGGYSGFNDRYIDIRVDDHETPIQRLGELRQLHRNTFGDAPLPDRKRGDRIVVEKPGEDGPRARFEKAMEHFRKKRFQAIHDMFTAEAKKVNPAEAYVKRLGEVYDAGIRWLEALTYVETEYTDDNTVTLIYSHIAAGRPVSIIVMKEEGIWKLSGF